MRNSQSDIDTLVRKVLKIYYITQTAVCVISVSINTLAIA